MTAACPHIATSPSPTLLTNRVLARSRYNAYWDIVGLTSALLGTIGIMVIDIEAREEDETLAHAFSACFCLSFLMSMTGMSLCVLNKVQFGFAHDKELFMRKFNRFMDAPTVCLILSGALLISGVCVRMHMLLSNSKALAWSMSGVGIALFVGMILLRVRMKRHNVRTLDQLP